MRIRSLKNIELEIKKLDYLYENLPSALLAVFILSTIMLFSLYDNVDTNNLMIWFTLNLILIMLRVKLLFSYNKIVIRPSLLSKYYKSFFLLSTLNAILWGSSAFFILPADIESKMIIIFLIAGLASGSAVSLSSKIEIFYIYIIFTILPFAYIFYIEHSQNSLAFSLSLLLYMLVLSTLAKKISKNINNNILFAFENKNLVIQLEEKIKEANMANKAKSEFLSTMSHEIRTPLNAIIGFVQILKKNETDTNKAKYLQTIDKSSKVLTNIINDILDITKIESGKFTLELSEFSPKEEFNSLFSLFEQNAIEKNIKLISSISPNLPLILKSDILRIKQIVSNLLSNAIKFTPKNKSIELIVNFDEENSSLYVEVKDQGIGVSKKNIDFITQAFTQADSSIARAYGGTGLGLSIVTNLLRLLHSKLKIKSELDKGSSFSFNLKVDVIQKALEEKIELTQDSDEISFASKKILVAEDNKTNQMLISLILDDLDINVTIANDGLEAQDMFKKEVFDLVLMDINMPNQNGIDSMLDIKEYEKSKESFTPIIALTANAVSGDKEMYLKKGFDDYVAKPIEIDELVKVLRTHFN